jgi:PAS domain S-box-containing protein
VSTRDRAQDAREPAGHDGDELSRWFELARGGMLVYDGSGLILRFNPAFASLVEHVPVRLSEAAPALQALLAWQGGRPRPELVPGAAALELQAALPLGDGRLRHLTARLAALPAEAGQLRVMAWIEDRSAEDERDLARLEIGMLMDAASVGVATYEPSRGWLMPPPRAERPGARRRASGLQGIGRDLVEPASLPEYERLQRALRQGVRAEVRYAVRHPELGPRWLLTRVEPGVLPGGRAATSVVTLDITDQEQAHHRNEQLVRERELMFGLSDVGITYQRGSRIERANQAMSALTGYAPPEFSALDGAELYESARECVDFEERLAQSLRSHGRFSGERRLRRRDGSLRWVQVSARPVDAEDPGAGVICSFVDVDERHRARESLADQADRTRAVLNSVLVGIVTVTGGVIDWLNRSARRMFGGELADFVGEPIGIVATPEPDHPLRRGDWLLRLAEGQAETFECRLKARDGREFWVVGNVVATGREAAARQLTFALLDIERRRQAEISIAQAQASLQRVIETAPLAIALFDARSLRVLQLNQMTSAYFGRPLEALLGRSLSEVCAPRKAARLEAWLRMAAESGEVLKRELLDDDEEQGGDAARVWDTRIVALAASPGAPAQLLLVGSDVTEQRAAEQARLQSAIAQRELLVREVHHRIKNNLQGVAGLLQQNAARHPEVATVLFEAVAQVQAIAQVYGLQVGAGGPLRVASVVQSIAQSVQRTFGRAIAVEVVEPLDHLLPEAESIPVALTLNELLTNAVRHGAGDVRCRVEGGEDMVAVVIANPGRLPAGFSLASFPGGVSGLGLVRALLPRRRAGLSIEQRGDEVLARVTLNFPTVTRPAAPGLGENAASTA